MTISKAGREVGRSDCDGGGVSHVSKSLRSWVLSCIVTKDHHSGAGSADLGGIVLHIVLHSKVFFFFLLCLAWWGAYLRSGFQGFRDLAEVLYTSGDLPWWFL